MVISRRRQSSGVTSLFVLMSLIFALSASQAMAATLIDAGNSKPSNPDDYFKKRAGSVEVKKRKRSLKSGDHYLALHLGGFIKGKSYNWGGINKEDAGAYSTGITYRVGEWVNSTDFLVRIDFNSYELDSGNSTKMSLMPMVSFPDATSNFPLYFGAAGGLGVFFKQVESESALSLDYQLFAGGRFFNVFDSVGLLFETGIKNHVNILSDGQFNSTYFNAGTVFVF